MYSSAETWESVTTGVWPQPTPPLLIMVLEIDVQHSMAKPRMTSLHRELKSDTLPIGAVHMAFGYKYSMVCLPDFNRESRVWFLLPDYGRTKERRNSKHIGGCNNPN